MLQKIERLYKRCQNKEGQSIIELGIGTVIVAVVMTAMFDFALVIQAKTESLMMARNGVRYLIMQGLATDKGTNDALAKKTASTIRGLYDLNHGTASSRKYVTLNDVVVENTKNPHPIRNAATGQNPVYAKVCLNVKTIGPSFGRSGVVVCSEYAGFHSAQFKAQGQ